MIVTIGKDKLLKLLHMQLENNFSLDKNDIFILDGCIDKALLKAENCYAGNTNKYYWDCDANLVFNPYHSSQYSIFLYFLSRTVFLSGHRELADKTYYLNRMMNSCDLYYEVELPDIFFIDHPIGSVIGRGVFGNYFAFRHNCTVGGNHGIFPRFGELVCLFSNSTVIGNSIVGDNVFISANTLIKDEVVPDNSIVFGTSPNLVIKNKPKEYFYEKSPFGYHKTLLK
jgi:serine O-acetyltransferase